MPKLETFNREFSCLFLGHDLESAFVLSGFHDFPQRESDTADEIAVAPSVVVKNLQDDLFVVIPLTELLHAGDERLPDRIEVVLDDLALVDGGSGGFAVLAQLADGEERVAFAAEILVGQFRGAELDLEGALAGGRIRVRIRIRHDQVGRRLLGD